MVVYKIDLIQCPISITRDRICTVKYVYLNALLFVLYIIFRIIWSSGFQCEWWQFKFVQHNVLFRIQLNALTFVPMTTIQKIDFSFSLTNIFNPCTLLSSIFCLWYVCYSILSFINLHHCFRDRCFFDRISDESLKCIERLFIFVQSGSKTRYFEPCKNT